MPRESPSGKSASERDGPAALRRLKWIAVLAALGFILVLELVRSALYPYLAAIAGKLLMGTAIFMGCLFFFGALFGVLERMQARLEHRNRELLALHDAVLGIYGDLALEAVLQRVVDQARNLVSARYGAISVVDDRTRAESFVTSGVDEEQRVRTGFPPHQPATKGLLAVPIPCKSPFRGNLYLAGKAEEAELTADDEASLARFATTAALAIDNAHLHQRLNEMAVGEERLRIAHEMHDGLAQVLAYVNTKAQAVKGFLRSGRTEDASRHLDQLAAAAREVYADVRESIIGLRSAAVPGRSFPEALADYLDTWQAQTGVECVLGVEGVPRLGANAELQVMRIVQELLANVRKHAAASRVEVTLEQDEARLRITVQDDGAGFNPAELGRSEFPRFGLSTVRQRTETIGGTLQLASTPGAGTRVTIELPTEPAPARQETP